MVSSGIVKKILVVDDEPETCLFLKELLADYEVLIAHSAKEALTILKKQQVALVLVDYFMPKVNGLELCRRIRKELKLTKLPLAFTTVAHFGKEITSLDLEKLKITHYIEKPFNNTELLRKVKEMVES